MINMSNEKSKVLTTMCCLYTLLSVLFYFLPFTVELSRLSDISFLFIIGNHAPYCLLLLTMLIQDFIAVNPSYVIGAVFLLVTIFYVISYIVAFILSLRKRFIPFGIIVIVGTIIELVTVLAAIMLLQPDIKVLFFYILSLIGNTLYCAIYISCVTRGQFAKTL